MEVVSDMTHSTRESSYKEGTHIGLKHNRTRKKYYLITDPYEIAKRKKKKTGRDSFDPNARPICSGCDKPTMILEGNRGGHLPKDERYERPARYCYRCEVIFPKYRKVVSTYDQYR